MGLSIAIVGLPNVGKSTLFNALTSSKKADSANFPFCTIEPNTGIVNVPDKRIDEISKIINPKKIIPAITEFIDIAGLVEGASQGEGLGNKFLSHIRNCDAVCQVVRNFNDKEITHVHDRVDPKSDIEIINTELILADLETIENRIYKTKPKTRTGDKNAKIELELLEKLKQALEKNTLVHSLTFNEKEEEILQSLHLITLKSFLYVVNIGDNDNLNEDYHEKLGLDKNYIIVPINAKIEQEISELAEDEKSMFLEELGLQESGLDRLIRESYKILDLETYFTAGIQEVRAWTLKKESKAPQAAGVIHTDFEKGFIKAETLSYKDFIECNGWNGAREKGKVRQEGKEYVVQDGDVMLFKFNN